MMLAVAGFLMLFGCGRDTLAAKFFGIVFAEEDIPFFAAFQDFLLLGSDALADLDLDFLFFFEDIGDGLDNVLANGVAVLHEFDIVALDEQFDNLVGDADNFFAAQSHSFGSALFPSVADVELAQNQFTVASELALHLLEHFLIRDAGAAHFILILRKDGAHFLVDLVLDGDFFEHAEADLGDDGFLVFFLDFDLLVFDELFDHLRGEMSDIVAV